LPRSASDEIYDDENYTFAYVRDEAVAVYHLRAGDLSGRIELEDELGVLDLRSYIDKALPVVENALNSSRREQEELRGLAENTFKVLNLSTATREAHIEKELKELSVARENLLRAEELVRGIVDAWLKASTDEPRLPLSVGGKVGLVVQLRLPKDGSLDKPISDLLHRMHKEKVVLRTCTCLAPAEAVSKEGKPFPLPDDLSPRLIKMGQVRPENRKGAPPCTPEEVAWRDLILAYNATIRYHAGSRVSIDRKLEPRPVSTNKKAAVASSELAELRKELAKKEEQNAAILNTLAVAMSKLGSAVADLRVGHEQAGPSVGSSGPVIESLAQTLVDTDAAIAATYAVDSDSESIEIIPFEDHEDLLREEYGSEPGSVRADSHITLNEARWELFDPKNIEEGGAYVLVRSVHNGELYVAPKKATIPQSDELRTTGPLRFAKGKGNQKAKPSGTTVPEPPKGGELAKPSRPSAKPSQAKGTAGASPSKGAATIEDKLTSYRCPDCEAVHGTSHGADCQSSTLPWGKMTAEARKEREAALAKKPEPAKTPSKTAPKGKTVKVAEKPEEKPRSAPVERQDPLKATQEPLTDKEEKQLRMHFGLKAPYEESALKSLSLKERDAKLKETTIPRWAVAAVMAERQNLPAILDGSLTLELFKAGKFLRRRKQSSQQYITGRWQALKAKYENTQLLEKPRTPKEKNFRKEFDLLRKEVGEHPALPKPRKAGAPGGGSSRTTPRQPQSAAPPAGSINLDTLRVLAELFKALK
jgi:hypothetical protein